MNASPSILCIPAVPKCAKDTLSLLGGALSSLLAARARAAQVDALLDPASSGPAPPGPDLPAAQAHLAERAALGARPLAKRLKAMSPEARETEARLLEAARQILADADQRAAATTTVR